jgi:RNA polymerase sigma factor (sigma-70 family)
MDDNTLIEKVKSGDARAIRFLVDEHKNLVWHILISVVGQRYDNEDLFQEIFLRVFKGLKNFRADARLSTWIGSIAHNVCVDYLRHRKREEQYRAEAENISNGMSPSTEVSLKKFENADLKKIVLDLIRKLPPDYRTVITLFHLDGQSYRDIADITGMPEGTIKSYISRGRSQLRERLVSIVPDFTELMQDL